MTTTAFNIFLNILKLFVYESCDRRKTAENQILTSSGAASRESETCL